MARVWPFVDDTCAHLGLAVSGGSDSFAMLLLAQAALPGRIEAATVDHGLRAESVGEARFVASVCDRLNVPHSTLAVSVEAGNLQEEARKARYAALGEWVEARGLEGVATAHHLDDQAETLLMRLNRGSGLSGLAGIRARTGIPGCGGRLVRPVLSWRRAELAEVVSVSGIAAVADPSNSDDAFDRVRLRKALTSADWLDPAGLARSAELLAEADAMLEFMIGREWIEQVEPNGDGSRYRALRSGFGGVNLVRIGVIQSVFRSMGSNIERSAAARLVENLIAGRTSNVAGVQASVTDDAGERIWIFAPENPRKGS